MTLVGKARRVSNRAERIFGGKNLPRGKFDAQTPDVFANRAAEFFAEHARQVNRMDVRHAGNLFQRDGFGKIRVQKIPRVPEPRGQSFIRADALREASASSSKISLRGEHRERGIRNSDKSGASQSFSRRKIAEARKSGVTRYRKLLKLNSARKIARRFQLDGGRFRRG